MLKIGEQIDRVIRDNAQATGNQLVIQKNKGFELVKISSGDYLSDEREDLFLELERQRDLLSKNDMIQIDNLVEMLPKINITWEDVSDNLKPWKAKTMVRRRGLSRDLSDGEVDILKEICRPSTKSNRLAYISKLTAYRPTAKGTEDQYTLMLNDLADDLAGYCDYAVMKAIDDLRKQGGFFPSANEIIQAVKYYDQTMKSILFMGMRGERHEQG